MNVLTEIMCSEVQAVGNGTASITPSGDSYKYSLRSVATYSCNTGFVLVGQTTRVCEDTNGGTVTTGTWSRSPPTCEGARFYSNHNCCEYNRNGIYSVIN